MSAIKKGDAKIEEPFGRSVPKMDSNMISAITARANRADVSNRTATFIVLQYVLTVPINAENLAHLYCRVGVWLRTAVYNVS